jgi:hypothetical protein
MATSLFGSLPDLQVQLPMVVLSRYQDLSRDRVVARVISRHYNPSQLGGNVHHGTFYPNFVVANFFYLREKMP